MWGRRHFYWQGPLHVEGPDVCCTVIVAGDAQQGPYGGAFRDELFGQVLQKDSTHDKGTKRPECPLETLATVTGSYTDKLFWNDEESVCWCCCWCCYERANMCGLAVSAFRDPYSLSFMLFAGS